MRLFSI